MGFSIDSVTRSALTQRGGVKPVAVETKRRPQDAAEGTQAYAVAKREADNNGETRSTKSSSNKIDTYA